jgi:hypothetical protein
MRKRRESLCNEDAPPISMVSGFVGIDSTTDREKKQGRRTINIDCESSQSCTVRRPCYQFTGAVVDVLNPIRYVPPLEL